MSKDKIKKLLELAQQLIQLAEAELADDESSPPTNPLTLATVKKPIVPPLAGSMPSKVKAQAGKFDIGDTVQVSDYSDDMYSESFTIRACWYNAAVKSWIYDGDLGIFKEFALKLVHRSEKHDAE
jgi:hypothetical protein